MTSRWNPSWMCAAMTEEDLSTLSEGTRFPEALPTAVRWSHALLAPRLHPGDVVVDATMGNGHDTLFLAQHVLPGGRVFAFDVQAEAVEQTAEKISNLNSHIPNEVSLIHAGHETFPAHLPAEFKGKVWAFMFNLGWLPGANTKGTFTQTGTTLEALRLAADWLAEWGLITVVCYPGHDGGDTEALAVEAWATGLSPEAFEAQKLAFLNLSGAPPRCIVVRKRVRLTGRKRD
jgi:hypothetical protein